MIYKFKKMPQINLMLIDSIIWSIFGFVFLLDFINLTNFNDDDLLIYNILAILQ